MEQKSRKEENAIILDFLPNGYSQDTRPSYKKTPIAQAIGESFFSLLELVPKKDIPIQIHDEVYIGEGKRDKIHHIIGRITTDKLTGTARTELDYILTDMVKKSEARFVEFFNTAQPLTTRMHQLELLPGLGKKHMWMIIEKREEEPFKDFEDLKTRINLMPDPTKMVIKRILSEIAGKDKHRLFTM